MSCAKVAAAVGLAALSLSACGTTAKPVAGTPQAAANSHKGIDNPARKHVACLRQDHVPVRQVQVAGDPGFQVGTRPAGPTVQFLSTPGAAQYQQIRGQAQGAEVIGSALLYPNLATDKLLNKVESCVALGVSG